MSLVSQQTKKGTVERTLSVRTMDWLICIALTAVGSIGLSYPETAARLGLIVNKHREVPFGTLLSLAELIGGVALAGYWLGFYAAIAVWPAGSVVAFILTLAMGGHVQGVLVPSSGGLAALGSSCCSRLPEAPTTFSDTRGAATHNCSRST